LGVLFSRRNRRQRVYQTPDGLAITDVVPVFSIVLLTSS